MSGYTEGRGTPVISLNRPGSAYAVPEASTFAAGHAAAGSAGVFDKLESFIAATRQLEANLVQEKARTRKLGDELGDAHSSYERLLREAETKNRELLAQENRLKLSIGQYQESERKLGEKIRSATQEAKTIQSELNQYKAAWSGVLQREREAKQVLLESDNRNRKLQEFADQGKKLAESLALESTKRQQLERHAKSYQLELQNTLIRLHSAEGKFNELSKELQAHNLAKKNMAQEIAGIEQSMKERFQWELIKERECIKTVLEKETVQERERFKHETAEQVRLEAQRSITVEREQFQSARLHLEQENSRFKSQSTDAGREIERLKLYTLGLQSDLDQSRSDFDRLKREQEERTRGTETHSRALEAVRAEGTVLKSQLERLREELKQEREQSSHVELELSSERTKALKHEAELHRLETMVQSHSQKSDQDLLRLEVERKRLESVLVEVRQQSTEAGAQARKELVEARRELSQAQKHALEVGEKNSHELKSLKESFNAEVERSVSLEKHLVTEKIRFDQTIQSMMVEVEKIREFEFDEELSTDEELVAQTDALFETQLQRLRDVTQAHVLIAEPAPHS